MNRAEQVRDLVERVPPGKVTTFAALSFKVYGHTAGGPGVVQALNKGSRTDPHFPWWRVVSWDGHLLVPEPHNIIEQVSCLGAEGVVVANGRVDLAKYEHDPPW